MEKKPNGKREEEKKMEATRLRTRGNHFALQVQSNIMALVPSAVPSHPRLGRLLSQSIPLPLASPRLASSSSSFLRARSDPIRSDPLTPPPLHRHRQRHRRPSRRKEKRKEKKSTTHPPAEAVPRQRHRHGVAHVRYESVGKQGRQSHLPESLARRHAVVVGREFP
jgi:hypothetical protein